MAVSAEDDTDDFAIPTTDNGSVRDICLDTPTPPAMDRLHSDFVSPFEALVCCSLSCTMSKEGRFSKIAQFSTKFPGNLGFKYIHHIHHISDRSPTSKFISLNLISFN